jgi:uncharacterized protein
LGRILILVILAFLIWLIFRGLVRGAGRKADIPAKSTQGEDMVACARCGVNLPRSDARDEGGLLVCRDNPRCLPVK